MSDLNSTLERLTVETLERHAFMFAESRSTSPDSIDWRAHLDFSGWRSGSITIRCTRGFSELMCEELLGFEGGEADEDLTRDVLLEFVNVLAGRVLSEISPEGRSVKLQSPRIVESESQESGVERHCVAIEVDGQAAEVVLEFQAQAS